MHNDRRKIPTLVILGLAAVSLGGGASLAAETTKPAKLEKIPGSDLQRVILTAKAAQRLAIATTTVREEPVLRWLMVEGKVEEMPADAAGDPSRVRVHLLDDPNQSLADPGRIQPHSRLIVSLKDRDDDDDDDDDDADDLKQGKDKGKAKGKGRDKDPAKVKDRPPAVVIPIGRAQGSRLPAKPMRVAATGDAATAGALATSQDYEVTRTDHGLSPGQRVFARIVLPDSGMQQKVIPYSAVFYDVHGNTWTYTNPEPLVFVRHRIDIEAIEGERAILKQGPATGTTIVTAGAPELMGVEQKFGQ
jgi:hypothetical protein